MGRSRFYFDICVMLILGLIQLIFGIFWAKLAVDVRETNMCHALHVSFNNGNNKMVPFVVDHVIILVTKNKK